MKLFSLSVILFLAINGCSGHNYELLTKEGDPVWEVSFGHIDHDGHFQYEDTDRDGHWNRVEKTVSFVASHYILVAGEAEQRQREIEILQKAQERRAYGENWLNRPVIAEIEDSRALVFFQNPGSDVAYSTFVIKGSPLDSKLQKEFEEARQQPAG